MQNSMQATAKKRQVHISKAEYDSMVRVNHAGEYGAKRIYEGQMHALKHSKCYDEIHHMYEQELIHLAYFENLAKQKRVRPTFLSPAWHFLGFALGKISGLLGDKYAMACTAAVEEVIDDHYYKQQKLLSKVPSEEKLLQKITQFRNEEIEHKSKGLEYVHSTAQSNSVGVNIFMFGVKTATKIAISLSKRV